MAFLIAYILLGLLWCFLISFFRDMFGREMNTLKDDDVVLMALITCLLWPITACMCACVGAWRLGARLRARGPL